MKFTTISCITAIIFAYATTAARIPGSLIPGLPGASDAPGMPGSGRRDEHLYCRSENDCCWQGKSGGGFGACYNSDVVDSNYDSQGGHMCKNLGVTVQKCVCDFLILLHLKYKG